MQNPEPEQIKALREQIQAREDLGITAAQECCADMLHTNRRSWQKWELGERKMHPAFWELAQIKAGLDSQ